LGTSPMPTGSPTRSVDDQVHEGSASKAPAKHQQSTSYFDVKLRGYKGLIHMVSWVWWTIWDGESFAGRFQGV